MDEFLEESLLAKSFIYSEKIDNDDDFNIDSNSYDEFIESNLKNTRYNSRNVIAQKIAYLKKYILSGNQQSLNKRYSRKLKKIFETNDKNTK